MDELFLTVLNMSLTGAFVITAICLARLPLKKAPKIISYCLWAVAGFRLICPVSIESIFSLIPFNTQTIPMDIAIQPQPRIHSGIPYLNNAVSRSLPAPTPYMSVNPLQVWVRIGAVVWIIGASITIIYGIVSFIIVKGKMREATQIESGLYEANNIKSPFVLGVLEPKIYLPAGLSDKEKKYIILHEQTHIQRRDHIIKIMAYFILCIHWFNPFVWAAFLLMGKDMEMSCDECVLKEMGDGMKKDYSLSLLSLATETNMRVGPLAFGEDGVKERIINVLNFKKPSRITIVVAVLFVVALSIGFTLNRVNDTNNQVANNTDQDFSEFITTSESPKTYSLENPTERQKFERMSSITLFNNGAAILKPPPISSYSIPSCTYSFKNNELLIYTNIKDKELESAYGVKNGELIARFAVEDNNTLIFKSAQVPLFADVGARYVYDTDILSSTAYLPIEWFDYFSGEMPWDESLQLEMKEYPDTIFQWNPYEMTAITANGESTLFTGMPIWNAYLADLTGDGLPEICSTVSIGSGIIDERIIVYDYSTGTIYELSDRMYYDYVLYLDEERLMVKQTRYLGPKDDILATGELAIIDGNLTAIGIDRSKPDTDNIG